MKICYLSHFTWPEELSKNCLCVKSAATVTRRWIGSHPILTGAMQLSRACSLLAAWVIWAFSQLPFLSGVENPIVWRESWLPLELCGLGLPQDEDPPLHVCFQACSVGSFKAGTWSWTPRSSFCIVCRCSSQVSNWPPSMALCGRSVHGGQLTLETSFLSSSSNKLSQVDSYPDLRQAGGFRTWTAGLRRAIALLIR